MKDRPTLQYAQRLYRGWSVVTSTLIFTTFGLTLIGFRWLFVPLVLLVQVGMWRTGYWEGWMDGNKQDGQAVPDAAESRLPNQ